MKPNILGVDPGKRMSFALLTGDGEMIKILTLDEYRNPILLKQAFYSFRVAGGNKMVVVSEGSFGMPNQSLQSTLALITPMLVLSGIAVAYGHDWHYVAPATWKAHFNLPGGAANKHVSIQRAIVYWPKHEHRFKSKRGSDRSEAALIALHFIQKELGHD